MSTAHQAEFKSTRTSNFFVGIGLLLPTVGIFWLTLFRNEDDLLSGHARRGGIIKLIEQTIGWNLFVILMITFALWLLVYAAVHLWKALDATPDVRAFDDHLEFHPAVRSTPARYDEISHWFIEFVNGHPVLWLHFYKPYWSLQGLFKRKTVKLEGDRNQLNPLAEFLGQHPLMRERFGR